MAEEYFKKFGGNLFTVKSASLNPGQLNKYVIRVLQKDEIDISNKMTKNTFDLYD